MRIILNNVKNRKKSVDFLINRDFFCQYALTDDFLENAGCKDKVFIFFSNDVQNHEKNYNKKELQDI